MMSAVEKSVTVFVLIRCQLREVDDSVCADMMSAVEKWVTEFVLI